MLRGLFADGESIRAEEDITIAFKRANCYAWWIVKANIQIAVAEHLHPSRAAGRICSKSAKATSTSPDPPFAINVALPALAFWLIYVRPPSTASNATIAG